MTSTQNYSFPEKKSPTVRENQINLSEEFAVPIILANTFVFVMA